LKSAATCGS